jgi:hypothetical protein
MRRKNRITEAEKARLAEKIDALYAEASPLRKEAEKLIREAANFDDESFGCEMWGEFARAADLDRLADAKRAKADRLLEEWARLMDTARLAEAVVSGHARAFRRGKKDSRGYWGGYDAAEKAARAFAADNGYEGRSGGWIYNGSGRALVQGWHGFSRLYDVKLHLIEVAAGIVALDYEAYAGTDYDRVTAFGNECVRTDEGWRLA